MDRLDIDVYDDELQTEIQLVADLMIAANQADGRIAQTDVDALLGVCPEVYDGVDGTRPPDGAPEHALLVRPRDATDGVPRAHPRR